jgi:hypothetical protein
MNYEYFGFSFGGFLVSFMPCTVALSLNDLMENFDCIQEFIPRED